MAGYTKNRKSNSKTKKAFRPSPNNSATSLRVGTIRRGGDGARWVITHTSKGVPRWTPITSAEINGVRLLTVNHLAKNIGNSVKSA